MIDLNLLSQLITFYEEGTITKAAEKLLISQPALTRNLQKLEDDLNIKLFIRAKNKTTFTETGIFVVAEARKLLAYSESFLETVQHEELKNTTLFIGSCAPGPIIKLEHKFKEKNYDFSIVFDMQTEEDLLTNLFDERYQVVITDKLIENEKVISKHILKEQLSLAILPTHPLADKKELTLKDLDCLSILVLSELGIWNDFLDLLPNTHFIRQQDNDTFIDLIEASAIPHFSTEVSELLDRPSSRVHIPINDTLAVKNFYVNILKKNKGLLKIFN